MNHREYLEAVKLSNYWHKELAKGYSSSNRPKVIGCLARVDCAISQYLAEQKSQASAATDNLA